MKRGIMKTLVGNRCLTIKTKKTMKKILFVVAAVASMVFTACNKEEFSVSENAPVGTIEFTASFDAETKTTLNNGKTEWVEGDEISINGVKFTANESGASVKFTNAETPQGEFKAPFTAVYPYSKTLPSEQTVSDGTFADESVVSVAYIEGKGSNNLTFKHVSSVIKFQVANDVNSEIVFESSENLAGILGVNNDATYSVSDPSKTITVKHTSGTFKAGETYYVSVLPTRDETKVDFCAKVEDVIVKSGKVALKRNTIMDAKTIEVKYVHLKPNSNWKDANARFAARFFVGEKSESWVGMGDTDKDGIYSCVIPEGYTDVIFCRMNGSTTENNWDNRWNQTNDLKLPTDSKTCYVVHIEEWSYGKGDWFTNDDAKNLLYLLPTSEWDKDNARFAAYFFGNGEKWVSMTKFTTNKYYVVKPTGYNNVIFCRMNGSATANNWNNKWNQTKDLTVPTSGNNTCTISNFWNNTGATGTWSTK